MPVSFEQKIVEIVDGWADDLHTFCTGVVESYDKATRLASVQPAAKLRRYDETGKAVDEALPLCVNVPVQFPGGRRFGHVWPVERGDDCTLQFTHHSLDEWLEKGGIVGGSDERRFSLSDAVMKPGPRAKSKPGRVPPENQMVMGCEPEGPYYAVDDARLAADIRAKNEVTVFAGTQIVLDAPQIYVRRFGSKELVLLEVG
jgi:hypothetical protein